VKNVPLRYPAAWVAMLALATPAHATPASIAMSATVADVCVVTNSSSIAFGVPSTTAGQEVEKTGTISIGCTRAAVARVGIDSRGVPGTERMESLAVARSSSDFASRAQAAAPSLLPPVSFTLFGSVLCNVELNCAQTGQSCDVRSTCKTSKPRSCPARNWASSSEPVTAEAKHIAWNRPLLPCEIDAPGHGLSTAVPSETAARDGTIYHQTEGLYVSVDF